MAARYYSTQRPVSIGTYPKPKGNPVVDTCNFDERRQVPEIGRAAWGWVEYAEPLTAEEASAFELVGAQELPPYVAVGVGRAYNVFPAEMLDGLALKKAGLMLVDEDGVPRALYKAATFEGSQAVDALLDAYGEHDLKAAVRSYRAQSAA